jgi:Protein of unknown function (DUF2490)
VLAALLLALVPAADIGDTNFNGWLMYFGDHPVAGKWGVHLEAQWRRTNGFSRWQQSFYRTAVNYDVNKSLQLTGGYAFAKTYPYGDFPTRQAADEHRIYQQILYKQPWKRVRMQYRGRFEQRWLDVQTQQAQGPLPHAGWRMQERLRLNCRMDVPLSPKYYLAFYNELLLHVPPNLGARILDQNRAYGALGVRLNKDFRVEMGYLHQHVAQRNGRIVEENHTIQLAIYSNLALRRKKK